jgi:hypothetical protein
LNSLINDQLQAIVPRVFSDAKDRIGFAETGNEFERARYRLAQAIAQRNLQSVTPSIGSRRRTPSVKPLSGKEKSHETPHSYFVPRDSLR